MAVLPFFAQNEPFYMQHTLHDIIYFVCATDELIFSQSIILHEYVYKLVCKLSEILYIFLTESIHPHCMSCCSDKRRQLYHI